MLHSRLATLALFLSVCWVEAHGNTRFAFGTIAGVNERDQAVILVECGNGVGGRSLERKAYWPGGRKVWLLDGQKVPWQEAVEPGRTVTVVDDHLFIVSSIVPGWEQAGSTPDPNNALCLVECAWAFSSAFDIFHRGKHVNTGKRTGTMQFLCDVSDGQPQSVVAVWSGCNRPYQDTTVTNITLNGGTLQATVEVNIMPNTPTMRLQDGKASVRTVYSFSVSVDKDGKPQGQWWRDEANKRNAKVRLLTRPVALPEKKRLYIRMDLAPPSLNHMGFIVSDLGEGHTGASNTRILFSKGFPRGRATASTFTFDGTTLKGEVQAAYSRHRQSDITAKMVFTGKLFANRFIFGTYQIFDDSGKLVKNCVFQGGFGHQDGPDLAGHTEAHNALIKKYKEKK